MLEFACRRPAGLEEGPWAGGALRGAFGRRLAELAEEGGGREVPTAWQVFFGERRFVRRGLPIARPFVLAVEFEAQRVCVRLGLFGAADRWREDAARAMLRALEGGVALREGGRVRVPWPVEEVWFARSERVVVREPAGSPVIRPLTPLRFGTRPVQGGLTPFPLAVLRRLVAIAPWCGVDLAVSLRDARERAAALRFELLDDRAPWTGRRWTRRQPGVPVPMTGFVNRFRIDGPWQEWAAVFAMGEVVHAGAGATFGFGRYRIEAG